LRNFGQSQLLKEEKGLEFSPCHRELSVPKTALLGAPVYERCVNSVSCGRWMVVSDKS